MKIIKINNEVEPSIVLMITGNEKMRVGRASEYSVNVKDEVTFVFEIGDEEVTNTDLASIEIINGQTCRVIANKDNKIGFIKLKAFTATQVAYKDIEIVSLWQVI